VDFEASKKRSRRIKLLAGDKYTVMYAPGNLKAEIRLRITHWIKHANFGGLIKPTRWERILYGDLEVAPEPTCECEVVQGMVEARNAVEACLMREDSLREELGLDAMATLMIKRRQTWLERDADFGLELVVLGSIRGDVGVQMVHDQIITLFPVSETSPRDLDAIRGTLEGMPGCLWWRFVHERAHAEHSTVLNIVKDILGGVTPRGAGMLNSSPFFKAVKDGLAYFVEDKDAEGHPVFGQPAILRKMRALDVRLVTGEIVPLRELTVLSQYEFFIPSDSLGALSLLRGRAIEAFERVAQVASGEVQASARPVAVAPSACVFGAATLTADAEEAALDEEAEAEAHVRNLVGPRVQASRSQCNRY
jgi:hypothetical protein